METRIDVAEGDEKDKAKEEKARENRVMEEKKEKKEKAEKKDDVKVQFVAPHIAPRGKLK
jgi:hypothetical protein